jgi:hypothetical protein
MKKSLFPRCLAFLLTFALAFGQTGANFAVAMPASNTGQMPVLSDMAVSSDMAGMYMSIASKTSKGCCSTSDNQAMKMGACAACCAAAAQTAMLSPQLPVPVQYAVSQSYDLTDTSAASTTLPPDLPPPKA